MPTLDLELAKCPPEEIHAHGVVAETGLVEVEQHIIARPAQVEAGRAKTGRINLAAILVGDDVNGASTGAAAIKG